MTNTELLEMLYDRVVNGEWCGFYDESLGILKRWAYGTKQKGLIDRVVAVETEIGNRMCRI